MIASSIFFCFRLKYNLCVGATVSQETAVCACACAGGRAIASVDGTEDTHSTDVVCTYVNRHLLCRRKGGQTGRAERKNTGMDITLDHLFYVQMSISTLTTAF